VIKGAGSSRGRLVPDAIATVLTSDKGNDPSTVGAPNLSPLRSETNPVLVREAVTFLRSAGSTIVPRRMWPVGGVPQYQLKGKIPERLRLQSGIALCIWGDEGWGNLVRAALGTLRYRLLSLPEIQSG
jgi:hypothetical protein